MLVSISLGLAREGLLGAILLIDMAADVSCRDEGMGMLKGPSGKTGKKFTGEISKIVS